MLSSDPQIRILELEGKSIVQELHDPDSSLEKAEAEARANAIDSKLQELANTGNNRYISILGCYRQRRDQDDLLGNKPRGNLLFLEEMHDTTSNVESGDIARWKADVENTGCEVEIEYSGADHEGYLLLDHIHASPDTVLRINSTTRHSDFKHCSISDSFRLKTADIRAYLRCDPKTCIIVVSDKTWTLIGPFMLQSILKDLDGNHKFWSETPFVGMGNKLCVRFTPQVITYLIFKKVILKRIFGDKSSISWPIDREVYPDDLLEIEGKP